MDDLELLKKQWQSREQELPKLTYNDIYIMLLKKSTSIVKLIFYISIAEIVFWTILSFLVPESSTNLTDDLGLHNFLFVANILGYAVLIFFIVLIYINYKKIQVTDSVKELMKNILRTRKTVKYFIIYNVTMASILIIVINIFYYFNQDELIRLMIENYGISEAIDREKFITLFFLGQFIFGLLGIGFILLFYRLVYGILLRKLHKNYKELEKLKD